MKVGVNAIPTQVVPEMWDVDCIQMAKHTAQWRILVDRAPNARLHKTQELIISSLLR
jgi:hypothetical protein